MRKQILAILFLAFVSFGSSVMAQKVCTKQVDDTAVKITIMNATEKPFTVNYVDENCRESPSDEKIEPGRAFTGDTHNGHAFRVREAGTNKLLQEVVADPSNTTTIVGIVKNSDPRQGFLETLNRVRRGRNLPPMEFDDSLNQACQWFADLMAKFDHGGHDAVEVGGGSYKDMQHPWMRVKKFNYKGDGGTEATAEGDYNDVSIIGSDAMMGCLRATHIIVRSFRWTIRYLRMSVSVGRNQLRRKIIITPARSLEIQTKVAMQIHNCNRTTTQPTKSRLKPKSRKD